jgi:phospholipid-translocating ATPase
MDSNAPMSENDFEAGDVPTDMIDPELRLRTVRTAVSVLAESERTESRREQRRKQRAKRSLIRKGSTLGRSLFHRGSKKNAVTEDDPRDRPTANADGPGFSLKPAVVGQRRNIYVNIPLPPSETDPRGEPLVSYVVFHPTV